MSERSILQFFSTLRAPLCLLRQSWGAERAGGSSFLRALQDRCELHEGIRYDQFIHLRLLANASVTFSPPKSVLAVGQTVRMVPVIAIWVATLSHAPRPKAYTP